MPRTRPRTARKIKLKLRRCPKCGKLVARRFKRCRRCHAVQPKI